jgi:hypothetical protein
VTDSNTRWYARVPCSRMGLLVGVLLFCVGLPPFVYGWLSTPADRVYTGLMFDVEDHAQYWSWVTASHHGLFIANTMTPEPNPPTFLNVMMWSLAQVQRATGLSFAGLFQVWRLLGCLVLGVALVMSFRRFVPDPRRRAIAYLLAIAGSGLGWLLVVAKYAQRLSDVPFPLDVYVVEPNTWFATFAYPYLALAQGLVLGALFGAYRVDQDGHWHGYVLAIGSAVALGFTHSYDLLTVYGVLGAYWLWSLWRTRQIPLRLTAVIIAVGAASGPIALYYKVLTSSDPVWQAVLAQYVNAGVWTPPHIHLVILMGVPLLLAAVAMPGALRRGGPEAFLAIWAVVGLCLAYLPVVFQIKLLTAWQFPLAILGARTWDERVAPWLSHVWRRGQASRPLRPAVSFALLAALVVPTNLYLFAWRVLELRRHERPYYLHRDEAAALEWLSANTGPRDVVMAPLEIGQFVPNYGGSRAFLAHWAMTTRFFARREAAERFFDPATDEGRRRTVLDADRVTVVLRPDVPPGTTLFDPGTSDQFEPVFSRPHASVFRVRPAADRQAAVPAVR